MAKKLSKEVAGSVLTIKVGDEAPMLFDINELNDNIRFNLSMHGLSQKLGDSAAGKEGEDIPKAINHVWEGLMKGDWTVRAPAGEKVTKKSIVDKLSNLSAEEQELARGLLARLGMKL